MVKTLNEALELASQDRWDEAWHVAQQDEGLDPTATYDRWREFAEQTLSDRQEREETWNV